MTSKKTYRELQIEVDEILTQLQAPELDIDKAVQLYKQGQAAIKKLEEYLKTAKNEIEHLKKS